MLSRSAPWRMRHWPCRAQVEKPLHGYLMDGFPVFLDLNGRHCLVVGAGNVAARKIALLEASGADITVVAPWACAEIEHLAARNRVRLELREFTPEDVTGQAIVISATGDAEANRRVSSAAQEQGIWVNVVDDPALCTFFVPAMVRRPPVTVAIGTGGASPTLARLLRARIEDWLPVGLGTLAELSAALRRRVRKRLGDFPQRRRFWQQALTGDAAALALAGDTEGARRRLLDELDAFEAGPAVGCVHLVGAGPGDPGLLTLHARRLLLQADVIVYDRLVSPEILALARRDAHRIGVGKASGRHGCDQGLLHRILIEHARAGQQVVRLQGGDPLIFGRGGEELAALAEAGVPVRVVPGVTSALGCAGYAGIPLTHRDCAHACTFVTGHLRADGHAPDWERLARPGQTLIFYMGLAALPEIARQLMAHGAPPDLPGALVSHGTTARQCVIEGTLDALPALAATAGLEPPTLIILGEVVRHRVQPASFAATEFSGAWLPIPPFALGEVQA